MQCILYKIYFWKVFHMYYKLICVLYALLCGQNFILVKSGCYMGSAHSDWAACLGCLGGVGNELEAHRTIPVTAIVGFGMRNQ
jgi:hypothetical protein